MAGLLLASVACAAEAELRPAAEVTAEATLEAGCWGVIRGPWTPDPDSAEMPGESVAAAWTLRLDSLPPPPGFGEQPGARKAETFIEDTWRDFPFYRWRVVADTIVLDHPAAFAGTVLKLVRDGDAYSGSARSYSDVNTPDRYAGVRMVRTSCPD